MDKFEISSTISTEKEVHYIPVKIEANQTANVDTKFKSRVSKDGDGVLQVEFRGRPLYGAPIQIPSNFHGFVSDRTMDGKGSLEIEEQTKNNNLIADFSEYTYWNWDKKPSANDSHVKLLDWLNVAEVLHAPILIQDNGQQEQNGKP